MRSSGSAGFLEQRRLRAISFLDDGFQPAEIARKVGVDRRSVRRWKASFLKGGQGAVRAKPSSGRPTKLDPQAKKALSFGAAARRAMPPTSGPVPGSPR